MGKGTIWIVYDAVATRFAKSSIPGQPWDSNPYDNQVSKLSSGTHKIGPNSLLKVMAGDEISAVVDSYYDNYTYNPPGSGTLLGSMVASLVQTLTSTAIAGTAVHSGAAGVGTNLQTGPNVGALSALTDPDAASNDNLPRAYLTVLFFDERMQLVSESSNYQRVGYPGSVQSLPLVGILAPKNGYAYVYVSNESSEPVYFDNLQVVYTRGRIVEENHCFI